MRINIYDEESFRYACKQAGRSDVECNFYGVAFSARYLKLNKVKSFNHLGEIFPDALARHVKELKEKRKAKIMAEAEIDIAALSRNE